MTSDSTVILRVDPKDMGCGICYEVYSQERPAMVLLCRHSFCTICIYQMQACAVCRVLIKQRPAKNMIIAAFIDKDCQTKRCKTHGKPKEYFSNEGEKFVCSDCILEKHKIEYKSTREITKKVKKLKEQRNEIKKKNKDAQTEIRGLLKQRTKNLNKIVDRVVEEELEDIFLFKKKMKRLIDTCNFTDRDLYEHQLLGEDFSRLEQKASEMLEKWEVDQDQGGLAAQILRAPSQIEEGITANYSQRERDIKEKIIEKEKELGKMILELKKPKDLTKFDLEKFQEKISDPDRPVNPKYLPRISENYLFRTFEDYGIHLTLTKNWVYIWENSFADHFQKFNPKSFECSLENLELFCYQKFSDSKFEVLCDILQNIKKLSKLSICFDSFSNKKAELLLNLILKSESLQIISSQIFSKDENNLNHLRGEIGSVTANESTEPHLTLASQATSDGISFEIKRLNVINVSRSEMGYSIC